MALVAIFAVAFLVSRPVQTPVEGLAGVSESQNLGGQAGKYKICQSVSDTDKNVDDTHCCKRHDQCLSGYCGWIQSSGSADYYRKCIRIIDFSTHVMLLNGGDFPSEYPVKLKIGDRATSQTRGNAAFSVSIYTSHADLFLEDGGYAGGVEVGYFFDDIKLGTSRLKHEDRSWYSTNFDWTVPSVSPGQHVFKAVFDPDNNVVEDNEGNNVLTAQLQIVGNGPCENGNKDSGETDVDCGGSCPKCVDSKSCVKSSDCLSNKCSNKVCVSSIKSPLNSTGGSCVAKKGTCQWKSSCPQGGSSVGQEDCGSNKYCCVSNALSNKKLPCVNGVKDASESDVDCGGSCKKCALKQSCWVGQCAPGQSCGDENCVSGHCSITGKCTDSCGALWAANGAVGKAYCSQTASCPPTNPKSLGQSTDCVMCCLTAT